MTLNCYTSLPVGQFIRSILSGVLVFMGLWGYSQGLQTATYNYTGGAQTFVVPTGVTSVDVDARGAQGGSSTTYGNQGGQGARVQTTFSVTSGTTWNIYVGGAGTNTNSSSGAARAGGFNGGANGGTGACCGGAGGGGASDIRVGGTALTDRTVVAGGGGGAGGFGAGAFGAGGTGGLTGSAGGNGGVAATGGGGGTAGAGGGGGAAGAGGPGAAGTIGNGGVGGLGTNNGGGGGGGGYYGGGGGGGHSPANYAGGGGGGSSYSAGTSSSYTSGYNAGNGSIILNYYTYCAPSYGTGCSVGDQIENFSTTGGLTNITNNASGCSAGNYGDFVSMVHTQAFGEDVNFTVQAGSSYEQGFAIWVDWDQDYNFSASELMWTSPGWSTSAFTGSFTIPFATSQGSYRMRVRANYNGLPIDPCAFQTYGEVEEYTLTVTSPYCSPTYSFAPPGCGVGDQIENFSTTGGVSNISNLGSGCNGPVGDFTNLTHSTAKNTTVSFTVQSGASWAQSFGIWVDWDRDGVFAAGEQMWNSGTWNTTPFNGTFDVPCFVDTGATIMRVVCAYSATPPADACGTYLYGEAEEYTFYVLPEAGNPTSAPYASLTVNLNQDGAAVIDSATIDSASSDDCGSITARVAESIIPGYESQVELLGTYGGHAYFISNTIMNKTAALTLASNMGGYLATITSQAENDFILSEVPTTAFPFFIGLNDIVSEGTFVWDNGEPVTYTNWTPGEPNNAGNEDCAQMYNTGLWNDVSCGNSYEALIEVPVDMGFGDQVYLHCADSLGVAVYLEVEDQSGNLDYEYCVVSTADNLGPEISTDDFTLYLDASGQAVVPDSLKDGSRAKGSLYFTGTNTRRVWEADQDSAAPVEIFTNAAGGSSGPIGIEYASSTDSLYFAGGNYSNLYRIASDGSGPQYIMPNADASINTGNRHEVVIDEAKNRIFYTAGDFGIYTGNLDGTGTPTQLFTGVNNGAAGLDYNPRDGRLYMSFITGNFIASMKADGSDYQVLFNSGDGVSSPRQLIVLPDQDLVVWVNKGTGAILSANTDGSGSPSTVYGTQPGIFGLDYYAPSDMLYWTRFGASDQIWRAPADGSGTPEQLYSSNYGNIRGVTAEALYPAGVYASDNCGLASLSLATDTFYCANIGVNAVSVNATDLVGNMSSSTVNITVLDTTAPVAVAMDDTVYLDIAGDGSLTSASLDNGSSDNCSYSTSVSDSIFNCGDVGTNVIWFYATDPYGNIDSVQVNIEVVDTVPPTVVTQPISVNLDATGNATILGSAIDNGSSDACGIASYVVDISSFTCVDVPTPVMVQMTVTDVNGNSATDSALVTVVDNVAPTAIAQNITIQLDASGSASISADSIDNGSFDNCSIDTMWLDQSTFICDDTASVQTIKLFVQDHSGNVDSAFASMTIIDDLVPVMAATDTTISLDSFGMATITTAFIDDGTSDNCSIDTMWLSQYDFTCGDVGSPVTVTLFARDISGNQDTINAVVTIVDDIAPQPIVNNLVVALDVTGEVIIDTSMVNNGTWDSCGIFTLWLEQDTFTCADVGLDTIWFNAEDIHGNVDSAEFTITVLDTIAPVIDIMDTLIVHLDSSGQMFIPADSIDLGTDDACGLASITIDTSTFDCANDGDTLDVTFTATDVNGNISTDTCVFIIDDVTAPSIFAHSDSFYVDSNGQFFLDWAVLNDSTQDACGVDTMYVSDTLFTCSTVDTTDSIWFYAIDIYGNMDSMQLGIALIDTIHPIITCNDSIIVANDSGDCGAIIEFPWPGVWDNCSIDSIVQIDTTGLDSGSFFPVGIKQLTYVAYDPSLNTDTCSFIIEVQDTAAPVLFCQADTLICDTTYIFDYPDYDDNCTGFDVVQVAGIPSGEFYPVGSTINRFAVTDSYGNTDTCEYEVFRYDFPSLANAGEDQEKCEEYSATLDANDPQVGFGTWTLLEGQGSISDTLDSNAIIDGIAVGLTVLEWRIENGVCPVERDTMQILEYLSPPAANAGPDIVLCDTTEGLLGAIIDTIGTGTWLPTANGTTVEDTSVFNSLVSGLSLGSYNYTWRVVNGVCPITYDTVQVDVVSYSEVDAGEDKFVFYPSNIELNATSTLPVTYTWAPAFALASTDGESVIATPEDSTYYVVTGTTEFGCKTRDTVLVGVNTGPRLPTAFTPDGDNYNDVWNLKELASYPDCVVKIYDRWGHLMFESNGYQDSWDGTVNSEPLPSGSYFYVIDLNVDEVPPQTGSVTIIK